MIKNYFYILKKFYTSNKSSTLSFIVLSILEIFLKVLELYLTQSLVSSIQNWSPQSTSSIIYKLAILLTLLLYVNGTVSCLRAICITHLEELGLYEQERIILDKTSKLPILSLDSPYVKALTDKAKQIELFTTFNYYTDFFTNSLTFIIFGLILLKYRSIVILLIIIITLIIQSHIQKKCESKKEILNQSLTPSKRMISYLFDILTNRETIQEIKTYDAMPYLKNKKQNIFNLNFKKKISLIKKNELILFLSNALVSLSNLLCLVFLVIITSKSKNDAGVFILLLQLTNAMFGLITGLSQNYSNIKASQILFIEYEKFLNLEEVNYINEKKIVDSNDAPPMEISIDNLTFTYPEATNITLKNINLNIKPGEKVALVGENGCGKSTLIKLILGLYSPKDGNIKWKIDNCNLEVFEAMQLTRVVFQDYFKLLRPVRENIALGKISELQNESKIDEALIKTKAKAYINDLDSYIGPEFGGCDFSGGQWQKLAISRAYMREASLSVFDEATSSLDPETELEQFQAFLSLDSKATTIIVTHRLSITKLVDKIIVLDGGEIVEYGTHDELYKSGGLYTEMYDSQSVFYA